MQIKKEKRPKIKLLCLTNIILEYRIPVFTALSDLYDLTVAHYGEKVENANVKFKQLSISPRQIGPFVIFKENIYALAKKYEVVIALGDLHIPQFWTLGYRRKRNFGFVFWSIGVSASYNKMFDEDRSLDCVRFLVMNKADALVFYTDYPIKRYVIDGGVSRAKLFVANNTVEVNERIEIPALKTYFLFVGTLYKQKKIYDLLQAYLLAYKTNRDIKKLVLIGDGDEKANIKDWVEKHNLGDNISLVGAVFKQEELKKYYTEAIACVSPGQAGLTVLNSMAYGVPFVTAENAITGGEIFNISNGENGLIYDGRVDTLSKLLLNLNHDSDFVFRLSQNAQNYYFENRTMDIMLEGLSDSIDYAFNCLKK